jgi:hypothetical protein
MHAPLLQVILHAPWLLLILLYIILLCIQFGDSTTYKFVLYILSKVMLSVNLLKVLLYLLTRIFLLMDHFSVRSTAVFSVFLSCSTSSQLYIIRSIVCSPFLHEHVGLSYDFVLIIIIIILIFIYCSWVATRWQWLFYM